MQSHPTHPIPPDRLFDMGSAYRRAKVLLSAVELDIFSTLAKGPLDADALTRSIGLDHRGAHDFLDALVALDLLLRGDDGRYGNAPDCAIYLDRESPDFIGGIFAQYNSREYKMWSSLTDSLRTGKPQNGGDSANHFATIYHEPQRFRAFVDAMTAGSLPSAKSIAGRFPWADYRTLCDIGTAQGCLPVQVARAHLNIAAIGFDLPELKPVFEQYAVSNNLADRLRFQPGNFFTDPLPSADVLVFGRVLHNWDLPTKKMLLKNAHQALPVGGAVIVYETLIDDDRSENTGGLLSSLNMLVWTSGGFGYSGADCTGWMREAGFSSMRVEPLVAGQSMVVGVK
jgi:hypothetical protein